MSDRSYQDNFCFTVLPTLWKSGKRSVLAVAPVGSGKTRMAAYVAREREQKGNADFYHLGHRQELIDQPYYDFLELGVKADIVSAGKSLNRKSHVHICSVQTLINQLHFEPTRKICVLSIDEAHRVMGNTYLEIIAYMRQVYEHVFIVLWTATPYRLDGKPLGNVADFIYEITTPNQLFADGVLMNPIIYGIDSPDLKNVGIKQGDYIKEDITKIVATKKLAGKVISEWKRLGEGRPSVYFACSIAHSELLCEEAKKQGIRAVHLDGTTPKEIRSKTLARLAIGGAKNTSDEALDIVFNYDILSQGWDSFSDYKRILNTYHDLWEGKSYPPPYQPLGVLGDARPTNSTCVYRQIEGRICRTHPDKDKALLISHSGNWERHGFLKDHHSFTLDTPWMPAKNVSGKSIPIHGAITCLSCLAVWPSTETICTACGERLRDLRILDEKQVELKIIDPSTQNKVILPPNPLAEQNYLRNLYLSWQRKNKERITQGKKAIQNRQISVIFKQKFGRWPSKIQLQRMKEDA